MLNVIKEYRFLLMRQNAFLVNIVIIIFLWGKNKEFIIVCSLSQRSKPPTLASVTNPNALISLTECIGKSLALAQVVIRL